MNLVVCIKQVPDTEIQVKLDPQGQLDLNAVKWIANPYDEFAIEEALQARQKVFSTATVVAITLGGAKSPDVLRTALAMGCDRAIHINSEAQEAWLSPLSTGLALAHALKPLSPQLIFCGKQGIDHDDLIAPYVIAETLGISCVNVTQKIQYQADHVVAIRESDGATHEHYRCPLPALIGVTKGINKPRYPSLPGIMKAKKQPIDVIPLAEVLPAQHTQWMKPARYELPQERADCKMITGNVDQQATELIRIIREDLRLL